MKNKFSARKIMIPGFALIFVLAIAVSSYFFSHLHSTFENRQKQETFHHLISMADVLKDDLLVEINSYWHIIENMAIFCEEKESSDFKELKIFLLSRKYDWDVENISVYTDKESVYDEYGVEIKKSPIVNYLGVLPDKKTVYTYNGSNLTYLRYLNTPMTINGEQIIAISMDVNIGKLLDKIQKQYFSGLGYFAIISNYGDKIVESKSQDLTLPSNINLFIEDYEVDNFDSNMISINNCLEHNSIYAAILKNNDGTDEKYLISIPMISKDKLEPNRGNFVGIIPSSLVSKNYTNLSTFVTKISTIMIIIISVLMLLLFLIGYKTKSRLIQDSMLEQKISQNEQLKMALSMAEQSNTAKTSFLSNMSHDIRTPLNAIISMTDFALKEKNLSPKVDYYLGIIKNSSSHLMRLINNVLDMTRIESGKLVIKQEPFDMSALLDDVTNIVRTDCDKKKITLYTETSSFEHSSLIGDKLNIQRILINILSNAVKFTPELGSIWFTIEENKSLKPGTSCLRFIVEDTGFGIKKENLKLIFKPFVRETTSKNANIEGTGLGLAITKNLIETMGGSIAVESEEGKGTKFTVDLFFPICIDEGLQEEKSSVDSKELSYDFGGIRVLVVEDNPINRQIINVLLQHLKISCDFAENGKIAIEKFTKSSENYYDLIYMDIQMPELNGYETTEILRSGEREEGHTIPIIAMTANVFDEDVEKCRKAGMNAHIGKPIDPSQLAYVTNLVLSKKGENEFLEKLGGGTNFLSVN